uniref:Co-chaperone protein p23 n=1 Tax=Anthurium amnicola TaxID=1678845 RepID=A0A1D1YD45_9ARAE
MSRHPTVKWAQRSDRVYLTIELPDAKDVKLKLEPEGKFVFSATKDSVPYGINIELVDSINVEESKVSVGVRSIVYVIQKSEKKWWNRLLKQEGKPPVFLKVDWDKWVDEEEEEKKDFDFDDMDFSKLNMGGDDDLDMDDLKDGEVEFDPKDEETMNEVESAAEAKA